MLNVCIECLHLPIAFILFQIRRHLCQICPIVVRLKFCLAAWIVQSRSTLHIWLHTLDAEPDLLQKVQKIWRAWHVDSSPMEGETVRCGWQR